jgi:porin
MPALTRLVVHRVNRQLVLIRFITAIILITAYTGALPISHAQDNESPSTEPSAESEQPRSYLLGDLGREELAEQGYFLELFAMNDTWANTTGGNNRGGGTMGTLWATLEIDTSKTGWWDNGKFSLCGLYTYGRRPVESIGDYQFSSNLDAPEMLRLFEGYYEHSFLDDSLIVRAGVKDYTLEFATLKYGFNYINSAFFTPSTMTQIPFSFYPSPGLGAEILTTLSDTIYLNAGVFDAKPSGSFWPNSRDYALSAQDGAYSIVEFGHQSVEDDPRLLKLAIGGWHSTGDYFDASDVERSSNYGAYFIGEGLIWQEQEESDQGFGVFSQVGYAERERNFNSWYFGAGLHYKGLLPSRDNDAFMFGTNLAVLSSRFRSANPEYEYGERVFELSYRAVITPYLALTPSAQYIKDPGMNPQLDDAVALYLRSEVVF